MWWWQPTLRGCLPPGKAFFLGGGNIELRSPSLGRCRPQHPQGSLLGSGTSPIMSHSCPTRLWGRVPQGLHCDRGLSSFRPRASRTWSRAPRSPTASRSCRVSGHPAARIPLARSQSCLCEHTCPHPRFCLLTALGSAPCPQPCTVQEGPRSSRPPKQHLPQHRGAQDMLPVAQCAPLGPQDPPSPLPGPGALIECLLVACRWAEPDAKASGGGG